MYNFHYDPLPTFPAYIWQTWKVSPSAGSFEEKFRPYEASWTNKHPSFIHEVITDDIAPTLIGYLYAGVPEVAEAYNALPFAILKADFFRYLILLARGGIYSDIDTSALKSSVDWIPEPFVPHSGLVIGIEADPDREDWKTWYSRRVQFCQWTIMAKPGHPVLAHVVADITLKTLTRLRNKTLSRLTQAEIVDFTGPALWTDRIFDYMNDETYFDLSGALTGVAPKGNITWANFTGMKEPRLVGDVVVLPITSFSPGVQAMGAGEDDDPMAFVKHEFEGSWKPESERHIGEQKGKWR